MPDPLLYLEAMAAAAGASAIVMLALICFRPPASELREKLAGLSALGVGLGMGYWAIGITPAWPPANGLDRLLAIVLPVALLIELIALIPRVPLSLSWVLRIMLAFAVGRILLHGSVYLSDWPIWESIATLFVCGGLVALVWGLLSWLAQRGPGVSIPLALAMAIQAAGVAIMLAGYVKGGAAALPTMAAIVGTIVAARSLRTQPDTQSAISVGAIVLFGLLFIGRFFGALSTVEALTILLAPLLCWTTEFLPLRKKRPWIVGGLRLVLVAVPLVIVLVLAKIEFDRDTAPLLVLLPPQEIVHP